MKGIRDWVFSQVLSNSLASSRPLSGSGVFFPSGAVDEDSGESARVAQLEASSPPSDTSCSSNINEGNVSQLTQPQAAEDDYFSSYELDGRGMDQLAKIEKLRIKFFRLIERFGKSQDNLLVAKVLYRIQLAASIRAGETNMKRVKHDRVRTIAAQQEACGSPELNFPIRILVLGKTGVGKSATINSIFDQTKTMTNAFHPATVRIQEVVGTVNGIKVTFIDTPGFLPSSTRNVGRNRRIMLSIKRFIRKSPPDIVLFFERLDLINMGYSDLPLLKLMTEVFGGAMWFNTILVLTHASSMLPEGPSGYPVNYESYVNTCTDLMQCYIHQAVSDTKLENPVLLVENHPKSRKNFNGETVLPNGQVWKSRLLLLCICTKVLADANAILKFQDTIELGPSVNTRVPSLPHLLSSLLQHHSVSGPNDADHEIEEILLADSDEEDDYDQLPSIRILTKSQFERLTKLQKREYLDELDYREILFLKKQMKEDSRKRKEKLQVEENFGDDNNSENQQDPEAVLLPDMAVPPSFDADCPIHRYRCLVTSDEWLVRPVLDPHGWDHDVGFDGINFETALELKKNVHTSVTGQMSKDKENFSIHSECGATYSDPRGPTYSVGVDVQSSGKDMIYTLHSDSKLRNLKHNIPECAVSVTSFGNKYYFGAKLEDTILVGKRLKFAMNAGQMRGPRQVAYGGNFEATVRGRDYPVITDRVSFSLSALTYDKEMVLGGGIQSEFRPMRGMQVAMSANLNSRKMGKVSVKISSSDHIEIALIAVFSIFKALMRKKVNENHGKEALEMG